MTSFSIRFSPGLIPFKEAAAHRDPERSLLGAIPMGKLNHFFAQIYSVLNDVFVLTPCH